MPNRTTLIERAAAFAREAHASQRRKGAGAPPYFVHLEGVVQRLRAFGYGDETLLAAAYLHDVMEDQGAWIGKMVAEFPRAVVETVAVLTEEKLDADGNHRPKRERVEEYIAKLSRETDEAHRAAPISCADKLDNLESLLASQRAGTPLLSVLNTRPGQYADQLARLRAVYAGRVAPPLLSALDRAIAELLEYIVRWMPGHAMSIAAHALEGVRSAAGEAALLHTMRVVLRARTPEEQMLAALHTVAGLPDWPLTRLADEGIPGAVLLALEDWTAQAGAGAPRSELSASVAKYDIADALGSEASTIADRAEPFARLLAFHVALRPLQ